MDAQCRYLITTPMREFCSKKNITTTIRLLVEIDWKRISSDVDVSLTIGYFEGATAVFYFNNGANV